MSNIYSLVLIFNILLFNLLYSQTDKLDFSLSFDADIIAFGEASHGDETVYDARQNIIDQIKKTSDKINVLVEMPQGVTYIFDDFFNNKIDSSYFLNQLKLYGLQTNSFLDFINLYKSDTNVIFYGIDMQHHRLSVKKIISELHLKIPEESLKQSRVLKSLNYLDVSFKKKFNFVSNIDSIKEEINEHISIVDNFIDKNEKNLKQGYDYWLNIVLPLKVINQCYRLAVINKENPTQYNWHRDSCMASNIAFINSNTKEKTLIFAANTHVSKEAGFMGDFLNQKYRDNYYAICTQYYSGEVLIVNESLEVETVRLNKFKGGLPYKINKLYNKEQQDLFEIFIDNKHFKKQKLINKNCYIQDIGAYFSKKYKRSGYSYGKPSLLYDAVYFSCKVVPSVRLIK